MMGFLKIIFLIFVLMLQMKCTLQACYDKIYDNEPKCVQYDYYKNCINFGTINYYEMHCYTVEDYLDSERPYDIFKIAIYTSNRLRLTSESFAEFINVKSINMSSNNITDIAPGVFAHLSKLEKLNMSNNLFRVLSPKSFYAGKELTVLDLSKNNITIIEKNALANMSALKDLFLNNNKISILSPLIENCYSLEQLDVSRNNISRITITKGCSDLKYLYVSYNQITAFNVNTSDTVSLTTLDLSWNELNYLSKDNLKNLDFLSELNLSNNRLFQTNDFPVNLLQNKANLQSLNLSSTGLNSLTVGSFTKLRQLRVLDLSKNNLGFLAKGIFHDLRELVKLYLNDNRLASFQLEGLGSLSEINLNNNLWSCDALSDITKKLISSKISILYGNVHDDANILGIRCLNSDKDWKHFPTQTNTTDVNLNILEKEYYSFFSKVYDDVKKMLTSQENLLNYSSINQQYQTENYWKDLNRDYGTFFQTLQRNVELTFKKIANVMSSLKNTSEISKGDVSDVQGGILAEWSVIQKNYTESLREEGNSFFQNFQESFQSFLKIIQEDIRQAAKYVKNGLQISTNTSGNVELVPEMAHFKDSTQKVTFSNQSYRPIIALLCCILIVMIVKIILTLMVMYKKNIVKNNLGENNLLNTFQV